MLFAQIPHNADERERLQELLEAHQQHSEQVQQNMLGYVHELESRLANLSGEIEAGLDPKQIVKMLGESLRQHFLRSGVQDTVSALQTTSAAMTGAQKELSVALHALSDSLGGVVAQLERANNRIEYTLAISSTGGYNSPTNGKRRGGRKPKPAGP